MGGWIGQAKKKLFDIIEQTKKDIGNLELRVAYIGYVRLRHIHLDRQTLGVILFNLIQLWHELIKLRGTYSQPPDTSYCWARVEHHLSWHVSIRRRKQPRLHVVVSAGFRLVRLQSHRSLSRKTDEKYVTTFHCIFIVAAGSYRDFDGYVEQYEGPYDFHSEEELPQLEAKLKGIRAGGGT